MIIIIIIVIIINCYPNFITCLCFPLALDQIVPSRSQLIELFHGIEGFKGKVNSDNN